MRALVTGASGFLGGRLTEMLVERHADVTVLARGGANLGRLEGLRIRVVRGALTDFAALREAMKGRTEVFHCAAASTDWAAERTYFEANVLGTGMLLEAALREPGVRRFVHVSTTDVYGYPERPGDEGTPVRDAGLPYNQTKILGEEAVWGYAERGLAVTVVRPGTIYGPRSKDFVVEIAKMLRQRMMLLVNGGRARGGFCYVDNVACALLSACRSEMAEGEAYNLTDSTDVTWRQYCEELAEGLGLRRPWIDLPYNVAYGLGAAAEAVHSALLLPGRPLLTRHAVAILGRDQEFSAAKASRDFGYVAGIGFAEGMRRSVAWLRTQG